MTTNWNENHHPRNRVGEFAEKAGSAPEGSLAATANPSVSVPAKLWWVEKGVLPSSRHTVPRDVARVSEVELTARTVAATDAPVALTMPESDRDAAKDLRLIDGELCERRPECDGDRLAAEALYTNSDGVSVTDAKSEEDAIAEAQREIDKYVVIDGETWAKTPEPVLRVVTFGFGGNHGGTSVRLGRPDTETDGHTQPGSVFPIDKVSDAIEYAVRVAEERGDTESAKRINSFSTGISVNRDVFTPGTTFRQAPRLDYTPYYQLQDEGEVRREFDRFKAQLLAVPGAVLEVDDGWGGRTKTVDTSVLTSEQANDYLAFAQSLNATNRGTSR